MQRRHLGACAHDDSERGFTLIELMVVVMIIAILIAILIPTFLGASKRANNRAAQADLRNGLTAEKTVYADGQTYLDSQSAANIATLKGIEAQLNWQSTGSTAPKALIVTVGDAVTVGDKGVVCLTETSKTTDVFSVADIANGVNAGTYFLTAACPGTPTVANIITLATSW